MLERYSVIGGHLRLSQDGTVTSYADAQATIADLQTQLAQANDKAREYERQSEHVGVALAVEAEAHQALREKYQNLVAFYDKHNGTPCEQIRHQQQIADLRGQLSLSNERAKTWEVQAMNMQAVNAERCRESEQLRKQVADLQGQVAAAQVRVRQLTELNAQHMNGAVCHTLYMAVLGDLEESNKQRDALQQRVARLERERDDALHAAQGMSNDLTALGQKYEAELDTLQADHARVLGENKALVDEHRDFKVHLSHCNFGEHAQVCKYGREDTCPALMPSWVWFGNALQRSEALCFSHATLLGLVQALPICDVEKEFAYLNVLLGSKIDEPLKALLTYRASLPAQGGA